MGLTDHGTAAASPLGLPPSQELVPLQRAALERRRLGQEEVETEETALLKC